MNKIVSILSFIKNNDMQETTRASLKKILLVSSVILAIIMFFYIANFHASRSNSSSVSQPTAVVSKESQTINGQVVQSKQNKEIEIPLPAAILIFCALFIVINGLYIDRRIIAVEYFVSMATLSMITISYIVVY